MAEHENSDWTADLAAIAPDDTRAGSVALTDPQAQQAQARALGGNRVEATRLDAFMFDTVRAEQPKLAQAVEAGSQQWPQTEELAQDVYNALFKAGVNTQEVAPEFAKNASAIDAMLNTSDFQELRQQTRLDAFGSGLGASVFTRRLVEELTKQEEQQPPTPPTPPTDENDDQGGQSDDEGDDPLQVARDVQNSRGEFDPKAQQRAQQQAEAQAQFDKAQKQYERDLARFQRNQASAMRYAARKAADEAAGAVADYQAMQAAFGGSESAIGPGWGSERGAATTAGDIRERAKLARLMAEKPLLQAIARNVGRLQFLAAAAQRNRADHVPDEVEGIERGNDLAHMLLADAMYLADDDTEYLWLAKYADRGLLQHELHGNEPQGRGPIIFCEDESGSTAGEFRAWLKAIGLCLLSIAAKQKRDFRWIHFSSAGEFLTEDYWQGKGTQERVLASALHEFDGGTDFDTPLREALEAIKTAKYNRADIVFATDGICAISPAFLQEYTREKRARDFNCYGMLVGSSYGAESLRIFCDAVANVLQPHLSPAEEANILTPAFAV